MFEPKTVTVIVAHPFSGAREANTIQAGHGEGSILRGGSEVQSTHGARAGSAGGSASPTGAHGERARPGPAKKPRAKAASRERDPHVFQLRLTTVMNMFIVSPTGYRSSCVRYVNLIIYGDIHSVSRMKL